MRKILAILLALLLCSFSFTVFANAGAEQKKTETKTEDITAEQPEETITEAEMQKRLLENSDEDILYLKLDDNQIDVYKGTAADRSLRKQLIVAAPNTQMLRLYTNNKAVYEQMSKMLKDYENSNANLGGYKVITDKDLPKKLENGITIYRFWFMKLEREKHRSGWNFPIGIGIGIGWGHHHGPHIGIGW